jgi:hypothetical protein
VTTASQPSVLPRCGTYRRHWRGPNSSSSRSPFCLPLEGTHVTGATFQPPDPQHASDFVSGQLLRDAARLSLRSGAGPFRSLGRLGVRPRPYQLVPLRLRNADLRQQAQAQFVHYNLWTAAFFQPLTPDQPYITTRLLPDAFSAADIAYIVPRVLELVYTAWDMQPFAADVLREFSSQRHGDTEEKHNAESPRLSGSVVNDTDLPAPYVWDEERRAVLRAARRIARLYGLTRDELRYILDPHDVHGPDFPGETFRVLKEKETRQYGEYCTRRLVLAAWDAAEGVE